MSMAKSNNLDLTRLLPKRYRDKALDTFLRALFNKHLTKDESAVLYGFVGDPNSADRLADDIYIVEKNLERKINQLVPLAYAKHATEERAITWAELVQRLVLLGVPYDDIAEWLSTQSFNFAPPIDLDKFCNFNEYFWIGAWINSDPTLPYHELGIPAVSYVQAAAIRSNKAYRAEYYMIARGELNAFHVPISPYAPLTSWSDWSLLNLWVHRDKVLPFLAAHSDDLSFTDLVPATLPIIEYAIDVKLSTYVDADKAPAETGTLQVVRKHATNQPPLFDLYYHDGEHTGLTSSIFYYVENTNNAVDSVLQRRIARDENNDTSFGVGTILSNTDELLWFKRWNGASFDLTNVWQPGPLKTAQYVKYDTSGTVVNRDKFLNFRNYYWTASDDQSALPPYNKAADPEYYVIEKGGVSAWSEVNCWTHVSNIKRSDLSRYPQAQRAIIEFNIELEPELLTVKTKLNQVPKFKVYHLDQNTDTYQQLPNTSIPALVDAYTEGCLLAYLEDLEDTKNSIKNNADLTSLTFVQDDVSFAQTLVSGFYSSTKYTVEYGYTVREADRVANGNGQITVASATLAAIPQVFVLEAVSPTSFTVRSTVFGQLPTSLTVGVPYTVYGSTFTLLNGTSPFVSGDIIRVETRSVIFERSHLYVKVGTVYRTFDQVRDIIDKDYTALRLIPATPSLRDGAWQIPPVFSENLNAETRSVIGEGDLIYHFSSIIGAQPDLLGSQNGNNNWHALATYDYGLGGSIKQHNSRFALLVGLLMQEQLNILDVIDFIRSSYEEALVKVREYVEEQLVDQISAGTAQPVSSITDPLDQATYELMKAYLETSTSLANVATKPYFDSTMPVKALTATLPYHGLSKKVQPARVLDHELNYEVLVYHDGHETKLPSIDDDVLKRLVQKEYHRSNGQTSPGVIGGPIPPERPFAHQLWLDLSTMTLWTYNVLNDIGDLSDDPNEGSYVSDRQTLKVWRYVTGSWVDQGSSTAAQNLPWKKVDLTETYRALLLSFEQELYDNCPPKTSPLDQAALEALAKYAPLMKAEFEAYAAAYGVIDPYASIYNPSNAFTWNYSTTTGYATWHQLYLSVYGTTRPDLEPWISAGFASEAAFLADAISVGVLPPGTTSFDSTTMWPSVASYVSAKQANTTALSVDVATGSLLPPYAFNNPQQLLGAPPTSPNKRYEFGDLGPVELFWTRTTDYQTSKIKTYFKLDPLKFVSQAWGDEIEVIDEFELSPAVGHKAGIGDVQLHGEAVEHQFDVVVHVSSAPAQERTLNLEVVSVNGYILKVTEGTSIIFASGATFNDVNAMIAFTRPRTGLIVGDKATVSLYTDGTSSVDVVPSTLRKLEGISQTYVHLHRIGGIDLTLSANETWLRGWETRLAYRFNTLVDTDVLEARLGDDILNSASYQVLLKETEFVNSSWITAMRVTLLRVGTSERSNGKRVPAGKPSGQPGDDWVFRVDIYNPKRSAVEWYELDTTAEYQTFFALEAKNSQDEWRHYTVKKTLRKANAPFIVTGIQNLVTFIYGYADRLIEEGFVFNDIENPVLDDTTGRQVGWQLLIEQFINQQFLGVEEGSAFLFNPFQRKMWYSTPFGFVTDLTRRSSLISTYSPALLNSKGRQISNGTYRVFREEGLTEVVFDDPVYAAHVLTSSFEHTLIFDNYTGDQILIYDPFLGQVVTRLFFSGEQQASPNGKIAYGGKFIYAGGMRRNLEASVESLLKLYDSTNTRLNDPAVERARALLGFQEKQYFRDRGTPEQTEFRFWQGEIKSKGTNTSLLAYINSASYRTATIDEYWAYKIAEYGDAGIIINAELKVEPDDCQTEKSNYLFLESDETSLIDYYEINGGYDVGKYDVIPFDSFSLYTSEQALGMEFFDARGCILVLPDDEDRWLRYDDLRKLSYFEAEVIAEMPFTPSTLAACYTVTDIHGRPVQADCFEIVDTSYTSQSDAYDMLPYDIEPFDSEVQRVYYEMGDYIPGTNPPEYSPPKFKRLNHSTIQILDQELFERPLKVIAYGPSFSKYSPNRLYDYRDNTTVRSDIIWWDPARGSHHPAHKEVDYELATDPAKYNRSLQTFKNPTYSSHKTWGEREVGTVWWNTDDLAYQSYSDTKIYPDMAERLARWGALADFSKISVCEWVKSPVEPAKYLTQEGASGVPAAKECIKRERVWKQRVVAWKYSDNPALTTRKFLVYQPSKLWLNISANGEGTAVLETGSFDSSIGINTKITGAVYYTSDSDPVPYSVKDDTRLSKVFGLAKITSTPVIIVGSSTDLINPYFVLDSSVSSMSVKADLNVLSFKQQATGQYTLTSTVDDDISYLIMTCVKTNESQTLVVHDTPITATQDSYVFDVLGVTLYYTPTFTHATMTSSVERINLISAALGNPAHEIYLRSSVNVFSSIPFNDGTTTYTALDSSADLTALGWVAWNDPPSNPNEGPRPPLHKYEPMLGEWTDVGSYLSALVDDIKLRMADKWTWFDGLDFNPYKPVWGPWKAVQDEVRVQRYCDLAYTYTSFFETFFVFDNMTENEMFDRVDVYLNNVKLRADKLIIQFTNTEGTSWVVKVDENLLRNGDLIRVQVRFTPPTVAELKYDPSVNDPDPLVLKQLTYDCPYVYEERRDTIGGKTIKNYYYWVTGKETPASGNQYSVKQIAQLLSKHDGTYSVPQAFKFFNQVDSRPNRYGLLSVTRLGRWVRKASTYKLRLKKNPTLRDDDRDMKLKNIHTEWELLRAYQASLIPKELWDRLTDTLCGKDSLDKDVPYVPYFEYDERNEGFSSFGLSVGQVMTDPESAKETVKNTILNTGVTKYDIVTQSLVPDKISYSGFNVEMIDTYLATPTNIRAFMSDLWRFAKPKQVNELFFAVLQDLLTKTNELPGIFKTSFIALSEVRTIDSSLGTEV